jgi:iron complex transport system permease protein
MKKRSLVIFTILGLLLVILMIVSMGIGPAPLSPVTVIKALLTGITGLYDYYQVDQNTVSIVWDLRLPRILTALLVGAALSVCGAAFQGLFRNPLAEPFVIGASSGAALGAALAITLNITFLGFNTVTFFAFIGSLLTVLLVYLISQTGPGTPPAVALLLAGAAVSSLFSALVSFLIISQNKSHQIIFWLLGSFNHTSWDKCISLLPYILISFLLLIYLSRPLDILAFGEETAKGMGLSVSKARFLIIIAASLATAASVANFGIIGFLGLVAPHITRLIIGPVHSRLFPASALTGAIILVLADDLARVALSPVEIPIGILTAVIGAPFFLYLLRARQKELGGD